MGSAKTMCAISWLALCAAACVSAAELPPVLNLDLFSDFSVADDDAGAGSSHWTLIGAPSLALEKRTESCCRYSPVASRTDSLSHVGIQIEASRGFNLDISIYSNLGDFVDRVAFAVPQSQFERLAPGSSSNTRLLRVLWNNRTESGRMAGTGAYVIKTRVTLLGNAAAGSLTRTDYRIVGMLRTL
jgi:hypothetical protein